jgi:hypothetical protein
MYVQLSANCVLEDNNLCIVALKDTLARQSLFLKTHVALH